MDHPEDLYLLDAEQAVRELTVYLDSASDSTSARVVATTNYLATLLRTIGLDRLGLAGERLVAALEHVDEGQGRRLMRELAELTHETLEAIRKGSAMQDGGERLDRLLDRLDAPLTVHASTPLPGLQLRQSPNQPSTASRVGDPGGALAENDLLLHAFKAIEAADSFAAILSREARPTHARSMEGPSLGPSQDPSVGPALDSAPDSALKDGGGAVDAKASQVHGGDDAWSTLAATFSLNGNSGQVLDRSPTVARPNDASAHASPPQAPQKRLKFQGASAPEGPPPSLRARQAQASQAQASQAQASQAQASEAHLLQALPIEAPGPETFGPEAFGPETPGIETPGAETLGPETPSIEAPGAETLGPETPSIEAPGAEPLGTEPLATEALGTEAIGPEAQTQAAGAAVKPSRRRRSSAAASAAVAQGSSAQQARTRVSDYSGSPGNPGVHSAPQPAGLGKEQGAGMPATPAVDAAFRNALRLSSEDSWERGMPALLESIDLLDHAPLAAVFPPHIALIRGAELRCQSELGLALGATFSALSASGIAQASLASSTLTLDVELDQTAPVAPMARLLVRYAGRIEVDSRRNRWQILVPASVRLLRVVPLRLADHWIAVSWAQYLGLEDGGEREAQLRIGDQLDRLRVVEASPAVVGVHFKLDDGLRRRERYRGLVLTPALQWIPSYA